MASANPSLSLQVNVRLSFQSPGIESALLPLQQVLTANSTTMQLVVMTSCWDWTRRMFGLEAR